MCYTCYKIMELILSHKLRDRASKSLVAIIYTLSLFCSCDGTLTVKPVNIEAVVGSRVQLTCSTSEQYYVLWDYASVGSTSRSYIFFSGVLVLPYSKRLQLDRDNATGKYNLVIPSVQMEDAGNYRCMDMVGHGEQAEAELIVLESTPQCQTDVIRFCERTSQDFEISCTVGFRGNLVPTMECSSDGVTMSSSAPNGQTGNSVTYNMQLTAHWPLDDGHPIVCRTTTSHVSSIVKPTVMYAYGSNRTITLDHRNRDPADCKANSSEHCSYQWIRKDTSAVISDSQTLTSVGLETGQYVCNATCRPTLRDQVCVVTPLVVNLSTQEDAIQIGMSPVQSGDTTAIVAVGTSVFIILIFICALVVVYAVRKRRLNRSGHHAPPSDLTSSKESSSGSETSQPFLNGKAQHSQDRSRV